MSMLSIFSRLFRSSGSKKASGNKLAFPTELSSKDGVFPYLNFSIPQLQPIKFSYDHGDTEKAFEQLFTYLKTRHNPAAMCNWWKREEIIATLKQQFPESALALLEAADKILHHTFLVFSAHEIQADKPVSWSRSYEHNAGFDTELWKPGRTYTRSALLEETRSDIYFVWELNRHQHFLDLGKAYWYTGNEAYAEEFMHHINSWITQNPYRQSVNWVSEYEIALRGIFWLFGYAFFFPSDAIDETFFCRFYQMLLYHAHAVYESLMVSTSSPSHAHERVVQAVFLYMAGAMFPEYIHSKTWSKFSWEILQWQTDHLRLHEILEEPPVHLVRSLECYCLALVVRANNRFHIPRPVTQGVISLCEQMAIFMRPNGRLCGFGETPAKPLLKGMYAQTDDFQYVFAMAALLLKHPPLKTFGESCKEPLLWFFGKQGKQHLESMSASPPAHLSSYTPGSPYAVMRSGWDRESGYCLMTTGLHPSLTTPELKHADFLNFELYANGQEYLIDSGPYSSQADDPWNQYFKSAQAHNIITVDRISTIDLEHGEIESTFDQWITTPTFDFVSGYHTGFEDLDEPVIHRRSIFYYKPNYWIVCDLLTGEGQHFFDQYFHFPPFRLNVDFMNKRVDIETKAQHHFMLMPLNLHDLDVTIFTGGENPESGWISGGYKKKVAASFIKYGKQAIAPTAFHTLLYAYKEQHPLNLKGRSLQAFSQRGEPLLSHEVSALEISGEEETQYFILLYHKQQFITLNNMTFNGTLLFLRTQKEQVMEIILHNATLFKMDETTLFHSETPVEHVTLRLTEHTLYVICSGNYTFQTQLPQIQEVIVNGRRAFLKREQDDMINISTLRV